MPHVRRCFLDLEDPEEDIEEALLYNRKQTRQVTQNRAGTRQDATQKASSTDRRPPETNDSGSSLPVTEPKLASTADSIIRA